jgi:flagellar basal body L-ring protein FlgH
MSIPHFLWQQSACHVEMSEYDSVKLSALSTIQFKLREIKYSIKNHTGEKKRDAVSWKPEAFKLVSVLWLSKKEKKIKDCQKAVQESRTIQVCVRKNLSRAKKASDDSSRDTSIGTWSRGASLLWFKSRWWEGGSSGGVELSGKEGVNVSREIWRI